MFFAGFLASKAAVAFAYGLTLLVQSYSREAAEKEARHGLLSVKAVHLIGTDRYGDRLYRLEAVNGRGEKVLFKRVLVRAHYPPLKAGSAGTAQFPSFLASAIWFTPKLPKHEQVGLDESAYDVVE